MARSKRAPTNGQQYRRKNDSHGRDKDEGTVTPQLKGKGIKVHAKYKA